MCPTKLQLLRTGQLLVVAFKLPARNMTIQCTFNLIHNRLLSSNTESWLDCLLHRKWYSCSVSHSIKTGGSNCPARSTCSRTPLKQDCIHLLILVHLVSNTGSTGQLNSRPLVYRRFCLDEPVFIFVKVVVIVRIQWNILRCKNTTWHHYAKHERLYSSQPTNESMAQNWSGMSYLYQLSMVIHISHRSTHSAF